MRKWTRIGIVGAAVVAVSAAVGVRYLMAKPEPVPEQLAQADFAKLLVAVRPAASEDDFAKIPWLTSIWDARQKAAKEGKPILLWEMDGHPLGCG